MSPHYWTTFSELLRAPFQELPFIWGIVSLYFALLLNELTSAKASFRTALQTGFSFLWAGAQWLYPWFKSSGAAGIRWENKFHVPVNLFVTFLVLAMGTVALVSAVRRKYPRYGSFLGHTRFSNYFMITIFPMQSHQLAWTWDRVSAIALFALPVWLLLHFGLMPLREKK
jgi:hypothetical protein